MPKRTHEESVFSKTPGSLDPGEPGNSISINELLSNSDEQEHDPSETNARKPRNFIAAVVCRDAIVVIEHCTNLR
jgi:hypothetical protein